ncbi:hypothetical protein EMIHUDRAFT_240734 [Emiliania huxleyi CCMP1516]|uniref:PDZ domain-containing protein n=2 Tax=Emiliania huxleyi TaxID=2903 RepID=A0A0D3JEN4_EMIH1|nr:hypothetical protein EMIHUDRAFT_240734 [Emiliania huxleyi CCMP1516]EOD21969.1 hypothetical protein EMIHUDRAFT_240734 [Emiliania huxleyi CCMP1516]|eukprot:XP_005774398.1 hypothetical protein EMIHUDRAFT_240734 [Emiliania huxleyi CCMP1516]
MTDSVVAAKAEALAAGSAERSELAASETVRWDTSARANARRWLQSKDRGPLGLSLHSLPCGGVAVGSSARSAVVRPGDTITEVNGVPVMSVEQAAAALHAVAPGGDIVIALIRLEGTKRPSSDHLREDRICL